MWNVTGWDWNAPSADYVEEKISKQLRGGDVILMHDGSHASPNADRAHTVTATDRLIRRYKAEGFHFVTIPQMMQNSPAFQPAAAI
jgi:peptidoglycan/xylan/chitin deacetylase (PgdA/CDA1 family)